MGTTRATAGGATKRQHEVRIGMSAYWVETCGPDNVEGLTGHRYSALGGRVAGWTGGTRAEAVAQAREALRAIDAIEAGR